jgi:phosphomannomutase
MLDPALRDAAHRWIADDVDPGARTELLDLVAAATSGAGEAADDLADRMSGMPTFGTSGLRGPVRAGPNGMNRSVVVRATAGLAEWLTARGDHGVVVVGRDARHGSAEFATDTADVLAAAGFDVRVLPEPLPTPVLAHAVRSLGAIAGVQITASHNPPHDNGYKLYLHGGVQIAGQQEREIEAAIAATDGALSVPRKTSWTVDRTATDDYLARVATLPRGTARTLRIAATALHGVGGDPLVRALRLAGFHDVHLVPSQAKPDPDFPTVALPNPEEPGATDEVLALAAALDADLAVALDPDADRCALGVPDRQGNWRMLTGDETGALLGAHVLSTLDRSAHPDPLVATTIVSGSLLRSIAAEHRVRYAETLTGFKWLVRAGDGAGTGLVYACEEALGQCVDPDHVRDKDGVSAAVLACDLAATARAGGRSLPDMLDDLTRTYGLHETGQVAIRVPRLSLIPQIMRRLRAQPPATLAGAAVDTRDLLPDADVLLLSGRGLRVVVRPSGTEPKLKCYLQVIEAVERDRLDVARQRAGRRLADLRAAVAELLEP